MKSLLLAALLLAPDTVPPPSLDAYACTMKGRPGAEKFTLLIRPGSGPAWVSDAGGLQRYTVKRTARMITIGEEIISAPDGGGFEIAYELDRKTLAIRLLVLVGRRIDTSLQGRCEQFKHVAPPPGVRKAPRLVPRPPAPRN